MYKRAYTHAHIYCAYKNCCINEDNHVFLSNKNYKEIFNQ